MSILTGQISLHAPHSVDANGRYPAALPKRLGLMIDPIGPGFTERFAWPPMRL